MPFRSNSERGNPAVPANLALNGLHIAGGQLTVPDAFGAYALAERWNTDATRTHRRDPDPEWTTADIRAARRLLLRASRIFWDPTFGGMLRLRADGRYEVADQGDAAAFSCPDDDWCILACEHAGPCNEDREVWAGPDRLYPVAA